MFVGGSISVNEARPLSVPPVEPPRTGTTQCSRASPASSTDERCAHPISEQVREADRVLVAVREVGRCAVRTQGPGPFGLGKRNMQDRASAQEVLVRGSIHRAV